MSSGREALQKLQEGNARYVAKTMSLDNLLSYSRRADLVAGQTPIAIILGCSDSRVPAEMVFDQGLGDLFVIRVAGNIVAPSQLASVEFAAERYGARLVVVLGHTQCGAILATLEELQSSEKHRSPNMSSIVDRVRPSVEGLLLSDTLKKNMDALIHEAVRANVRASANQMRHGSKILEELIDKSDLLVVGAEYSLETGVVDFFDGLPD